MRGKQGDSMVIPRLLEIFPAVFMDQYGFSPGITGVAFLSSKSFFFSLQKMNRN